VSPIKRTRLPRLRDDETGQTLIEYAGMVLLISISVIVLLAALGMDIAETFDYLENSLGLGADNVVDTAEPGVDDQTAPDGVN
jgi:Flp pilus assembly pilin Flp